MKLSKIAACAITMPLLLGACSGNNTSTNAKEEQKTSTSSTANNSEENEVAVEEPTPEPTLALNTGKNGNLDFTKSLELTVTDGELKNVQVKASYRDETSETRPDALKGNLDANQWTSRGTLEPNANYVIKATVVDGDGQIVNKTLKTKTGNLALNKQTYATVNVSNNQTYGVGMPVVLRFDVPVKNRKTFESNFEVTSTPAQAGSWHWMSDTEVHYRPQKYWKPGTNVTVTMNTNSLPAGNGVYGQFSKTIKFKIGDAHIVKIDDKSKVANVFKNGKKIRTIPISQGKPGFTTRSGVKVISEKHRTKRMRSASIGIDSGAEYYDLVVDYALRLTNSGEFIHAAPWNSHLFGNTNGSHGCTGMSLADAKWLYELVRVGDVIEATGSDRAMESWNGYGEWNINWGQWQKGSAL